MQVIYNFALHLQGICSSVELVEAHFVLVNSELSAKYGEHVCSANQLQWVSILDSLDLGPFCTSKIYFPPTVKVQSSRISSFLSWQFFAERTKCQVHKLYTRFCSANSLVPLQQGTGSWQIFPQMLPGPLLLPFLGESLGTRLRYKHQHCKPIYI